MLLQNELYSKVHRWFSLTLGDPYRPKQISGSKTQEKSNHSSTKRLATVIGKESLIQISKSATCINFHAHSLLHTDSMTFTWTKSDTTEQIRNKLI